MKAREESELNNAVGQKTPRPRAASTVYFSMTDDGDVLAARPTPLAEVRLQPGVLRHTVEHITDVLPYVQILDVPVPQNAIQLVEFMQKIDTRTSHQVIEVPKSFPDGVPQRFVERRPPQKAEQLMEVPTGCLLWSRMWTFQFDVVGVLREVVKVFPRTRFSEAPCGAGR